MNFMAVFYRILVLIDTLGFNRCYDEFFRILDTFFLTVDYFRLFFSL